METKLVGVELLKELDKTKMSQEEETRKRIRFALINQFLDDTRDKISSTELNNNIN